MNRTACSITSSYLTQNIKYHVMNEISARKIWEILESKYLMKNIENQFHLKRRIYRFQLNKEISIGEHINIYTKLLADLTWMRWLRTRTRCWFFWAFFQLKSMRPSSLVNGKTSLSYNDISAALVNHEIRMKNKKSSSNSTTAEKLTARGNPIIGRTKKMLVSPWLVITNWERTNVFSAKKNIGRLIVQDSRRRRGRNQRQPSHRRMMVLVLTLQYFLSLLLFAI